ncbi:HIT family protein [Oscillatoria sp. CS-180]|uniref:HIT family protein n=1 Tax=Oscillatoria sp. CS-180 TaxID=3021720 RepID=UPI00232CFB2E|nr:HIT family protein [Oscillatoria sp. CS-180]MDB9526708.1 HIT family protein [Oscillatoria sp. CS-180]
MENCPFCSIVKGTGDVSLVFEDTWTMAFIPLQPIYAGACIVIPKPHIDHFTDIPDELAAKVMITAQRVGRKIREVYKPLRVGMVVHGFGVHHAHLNLIPQYDPLDITYKHLAYIEAGEVKFAPKELPTPSRAELDEMARSLRIEHG